MRHDDKQKLNVIVTLFPNLMQTYHEKRNPNARKRYVIVTEVFIT